MFRLLCWIIACFPVTTCSLSISRHSRRDVLRQASAWVSLVASSSPVLAASVPTPPELSKLQKGHARLQYLLQNWDQVTSVCGTSTVSDLERRQVVRTEGGGGTDLCSKTPLRVQEFLGYKSVEDPLYKADKLLIRATVLVEPDDLNGYLDVVERYKETADQAALLAYTSSWGEANPNGSKEAVEEYLNQTKRQAVESERFLRSALSYLHLPVLPPSATY